jgi:hypothetical protein
LRKKIEELREFQGQQLAEKIQEYVGEKLEIIAGNMQRAASCNRKSFPDCM